MGRLALILLASTMLLAGCASKVYSSKLLKQSAQQEVTRADNLAEDARSTYQQYVQAHKLILKNKTIKSRDRLKKMHAAMKSVRTAAKKVIATKKQVHEERQLLDAELSKKRSVAEGSESYKKVESLIPFYGLGKPHPKIDEAEKQFNDSLKAYTSLVSEARGYLTDGKALRESFDQKFNGLNSQLLSLKEKSSDDPDLNEKLEQLETEATELKTIVYTEIPKTADKIFLFPDMTSYSVLDRLTAFYERVQELEEEIP